MRARGLELLAAIVATGCASEVTTERLGQSRSLIYGADVDADSSSANVVVRYGSYPGCTGVLITPRVVLTASHCIHGAQRPAAGLACSGESPVIQLGYLGVEPSLKAIAVLGKVGACQPGGRFGDDLGLVFLERAVVRSEMPRASFTMPFIRRPTFDPRSGVMGIAGYSPIGADGSPFNGGGVRRAITLSALDRVAQAPCVAGIPPFDCAVGGFWAVRTNVVFSPARAGLRAGDSGAPLYVVRGLTRDPVGIASEITGNPHDEIAWFSDITAAANRDWILENVREATSPFRHSPSWLALHGKTGDDWWGEADYAGDCVPSLDADCDGWWDTTLAPALHDNCPDVANPDQLDGNDDGFGDACADDRPFRGSAGVEIRTSAGSGSPSVASAHRSPAPTGYIRAPSP